MQAEGQERDWPALIEALSVFCLILLYIWRVRLFHPWRWLVILGIVATSHWIRDEGPAALGLSWRKFRLALRPLGPWVLALAAVLAFGGAAFGTVNPVVLRRTPGSLTVYMAWGLVQQWLLNGYFLRRFSQALGARRGAVAAVLFFALAHLPNWFLTAVALVGGGVAVRIFQRYGSLLLLGLAHGLIGFILNLVVPDEISGRFLVGPRYILHRFGTYPEALL